MLDSSSSSHGHRSNFPKRISTGTSSSGSEVEDELLYKDGRKSGTPSTRNKKFSDFFEKKNEDHVTNVARLLSNKITKQHITKNLNAEKTDPANFSIGMSRDEFINRAAQLGLTPEQADQLASDVQSFLDTLQVQDKVAFAVADQLKIQAEKLPASATSVKKLTTNALAGAAGYLSSFLWGKIFTSLTVGLSGSIHGAWIFPVSAGPLNVLLSEPLAGAIRSQGAFHPSVDGTAYTDYNTASARLAKANVLGDVEAMNYWTAQIAGIIDAVIDREQKYPDLWFRSGVEKPQRDGHGYALDEQGNRDKNFDALAEKVITGARRRAFITDEMPFLFFTLNYALTGAMQPWILQHFPPAQAFMIDALACAGAGTLAGAETGVLQDLLRQKIQRAPLKALTLHIKGAKMAESSARMNECLLRSNRAQACKIVLAERLSSIKKAPVDGSDRSDSSDSDDDLVKKATEECRLAEETEKMIIREYYQARRHHDTHASRLQRCGDSVGTAINAYLGEKTDPPRPLQGRRAINRVIAKSLATPLSLVFTPLYTSVVVPAILHAVSASAPPGITANMSDHGQFNATGTWSATDMQPGIASQPDLFSWSLGLGGLYGVPLILGYVSRNQFFSGKIEKGLAYLEALTGRRSDNQAETETFLGDAERIDLNLNSQSSGIAVEQFDDTSSVV